MSGYPLGLEITESWPGATPVTYPPSRSTGDYPPRRQFATLVDQAVIFVHGSLDQASSFKRVTRRLSEFLVVAYDRRGYHHSRAIDPPNDPNSTAPLDISTHIEDLVEIAEEISTYASTITLVGQSFGGDVAIAAALERPDLVASIAAFEPPMPWFGFKNPAREPRLVPPGDGRDARIDHDALESYASDTTRPPQSIDPEKEVVAFFSRMIGSDVWDRMPDSMRKERINDGAALIADLQSFRKKAPFELTNLSVPALFGRGGTKSAAHHRDAVAWLAATVPGAALYEIPAAGHGAHLSHPNAFADFVREAIRVAANSSRSN